MMNISVWLKTLLLFFVVGSHVAADGPINIGSRLEPMVDDYLIERFSGGARLEMHRPIPREVAIVHDQPWEGSGSGYHTVFKDGDLYRMYYKAWHLDFSSGKLKTNLHPLFCCYAESDDGIHWRKPELGLHKFRGSKANNIVMAGGKIGKVDPDPGHPAVFKDGNPNCPPDARYKAVIRSKGPRGLLAFKSADGIHWSPLTDAPVITEGAFDSQNLAFWDPLRKCYMEYHRGSRNGRDVMMATSKDFLKWSKPVWLEYTPGRTTQLYTNQIEPYYRAPHLFVGFPARYIHGRGWYSPINEKISKSNKRCGTDYTDTGFITSRDGKTFKVWPQAFVRPGPSPELWMYGVGYTAWGMVETESNVPGGPKELSFYISDAGGWIGSGNSLCRYTLRQDGFVSAAAPLSGGELVTKPIVFDGEELEINFETSAAGSVQVEIQDAQGKPVPGFSLAECPSLFGNSIDYAVKWKSKAKLSDLAGKPVRLRFVLKDADLYAFRFGKK
ncbi:MAG: hypothetical protein U9N87_04455 [Planctomycetota bacterium]|nr:hypothetical protein [Planctomycetota bacterium]